MTKTEETWMDGITTEMMEHICDNLCKYPDQLNGEQLEDKCAECKMGRFVRDILNQYNNCAKQLEQMQELKERDTAKKPEEVDYELGATGMATEISGIIRSHMDEVLDNNDGWIPVGERLPEDGKEVLCTDGKYIYLVEYDADLDAAFGEADGIIAWQPLPKPYKEE